MTPDDFLAHLRRDAERMADLAPGGLGNPVPSCPGWTVEEALVHTGSVYSHKVACMRLPEGPQQSDDWDHGPSEGQPPAEWFRERFAELLDELTSRRADSPAYTWHEPDQTVGFWIRRMAQETAVHRTDVESGFDAVSAIPSDLAVDGIDEVLDLFLSYQNDDVGERAPGRGTVAIRTGGHIWRETLTADAAELSREPGPADALVSGEPSELLLWLWGRRPDSAVQREGDEELLAAFRERLRVVTQ